MNRTEKPNLKRPAGENFFRMPRQEGCMLDNTIRMDALSQAFNLDIGECVSLAQQVPCRFETVKGFPIADIANIDEHSRQYAKLLMETELPEKVLFVWSNAMYCWRGWDYDVAKKDCENNYYSFWIDGNTKEALFRFWPIVRLYFITDLLVEDKAQAVRLLHDNGYSLVKEVKGLSGGYVSSLSDAATVTATAPTAPPLPDGQLITLKIPLSLLAGKSPETVFSELSRLGYAECVIASVLMSKKAGKISKTAAGQLFCQNIREAKTHRDKIDALQKECESKYLLMFIQ